MRVYTCVTRDKRLSIKQSCMIENRHDPDDT